MVAAEALKAAQQEAKKNGAKKGKREKAESWRQLPSHDLSLCFHRLWWHKRGVDL